MRDLLTQAELKEALHYNPKTGVFTRTVDSGKAKAGDVAGGLVRSGSGRVYRVIRVKVARYLAHRLAVLYMTGSWPAQVVDHKNTDSANNKWVNLRCATQMENLQNARLRSDNKYGCKGTRSTKSGTSWNAYITVGKQFLDLGWYKSKADAIYMRQAIAAMAFGEFARETQNY
jgi:hypothetical protein